MSFTADLAVGFAVLLDAADVGLTWQPTGGYDPADTGLYVLTVPSTPDRFVVLSPYGLGDDPIHADSDVGLQVRTRAAGEDPTAVMALDDTVADVLLGRFPLTLSTGIRVTTLARSSSTPLGQDGNRRWSWSSNYRLGLHRPGPHRL